MKRFFVFVLVTILSSITVLRPNISFAAGSVFSISAMDKTDLASPQISITLDGKNLNDLYAYEAVLSFDSEKLEVVKAVSGLKGFSVPPKVEGDKVHIAFTKTGNVPGESGNSLLSTITFRGKVSGTAAIKLESIKVVDSKLSTQTYVSGMTVSFEVLGINLVQEPVLDMETGVATATLSMEQIEGLLAEVQANSLGIKTLEIEILKAEGAKEYAQRFPVQALTNPNLETYYTIRTPFGIVRVPGNMLTKELVGNAEYASLRIGKADTSHFSETLKGQIGERPVITLQMEVDGKEIAWNNPNASIRVTIPYRPTVEEVADSEHIVVWYIDGQGEVIPVETGVYSSQQETVGFVTNHFSTYAVSFVKKSFGDIHDHWSRKYVDVMASRGIIKGIPGDIFGYQYDITRADYVTLLVRMLGISATVEDNFDDVLSDDYFYETVGIAKKIGLVQGDEKLFRPRDSITREEMMILTAAALRYAKPGTIQGNHEVLKAFSDGSLVSPEAMESTSLLVEESIILGADGKLLPKTNMTRAEAATVLYRIFSKIWGD